MRGLGFSILRGKSRVFFSTYTFSYFKLVSKGAFRGPPRFLAHRGANFQDVPQPLRPTISIGPFLRRRGAVLVGVRYLGFPTVPSTRGVGYVYVQVRFVYVTCSDRGPIRAFSRVYASNSGRSLERAKRVAWRGSYDTSGM